MTSLAAETTDTIIDFLHDDKPSLCACGLTRKTFLPSTRYHLFSDITFTPENIESFINLLESPSPSNIASLVRHITLNRLLDVTPNIVMGTIRATTRLTSYLCAVRSLKITNLNLTKHNHPGVDVFEALLSTTANLSEVKELTLQDTQFERFDQVVDVAYIFSKLRWLSLERVYWRQRGAITRFKDGPSFHLRTLCKIAWGYFVEWMLSRNPIPTVQQLELPVHHLQNPTFRRALEHMSEHVLDLQISTDGESSLIFHATFRSFNICDSE
jgi:hypothetical protein